MFGFTKENPRNVRKNELRMAELQLITAARQAEYYVAMAAMLRQRVATMKNEVAADAKLVADEVTVEKRVVSNGVGFLRALSPGAMWRSGPSAAGADK